MEQDSWGEVLDKNRLADDPCNKELTHIISIWPSPDILSSTGQQAQGTA